MENNWHTLCIKNSHERDSHICFYEKNHIYEIDGSSIGHVSVTTFIHQLFPQFDADKVIKKMKNSSNWPQSKYFGKSDQEIKDGWKKNGTSSASDGSNMHLAIEMFLNDALERIDNSVLISKEWSFFTNFWRDNCDKYDPYRTEWYIWAKETHLVGSIDCVMRRKSDNKMIIYDWKRAKEIKTFNKYENGFYPIENIPNCNYWHYTIQLNIYRWILEKNYGLEIAEMYLLILHPNNQDYCEMRLNRLDNEVNELMKMRESCKNII